MSFSAGSGCSEVSSDITEMRSPLSADLRGEVSNRLLTWSTMLQPQRSVTAMNAAAVRYERAVMVWAGLRSVAAAWVRARAWEAARRRMCVRLRSR